MKGWQKYAVTLSVLATLGGTSVQAANIWEIVAGGALGMFSASTAYSQIDDTQEGQDEMLRRAKADTGVYDNWNYQHRLDTIVNRLTTNPKVKRQYAVYVNPSEELNAFMGLGRVMSVNKGTMDVFDDDSLAYVVAHELSHGEHKDSIHGLKKNIVLSTALSAATANAGDIGAILANVSGSYISNQVFTMSQEKNADKLGFELLADAGYNVGGAATSMAIMKEKYGDLYTDGPMQAINPNNHPKTTDRINDNIKRMYDFSNKHVNVKEATVLINNKPVYEGVEMGSYTGPMRAYLVAGKLARLYHDNQMSLARAEGNTVYIGSTRIVGESSAALAAETARKINEAHNDK